MSMCTSATARHPTQVQGALTMPTLRWACVWQRRGTMLLAGACARLESSDWLPEAAVHMHAVIGFCDAQHVSHWPRAGSATRSWREGITEEPQMAIDSLPRAPCSTERRSTRRCSYDTESGLPTQAPSPALGS